MERTIPNKKRCLITGILYSTGSLAGSVSAIIFRRICYEESLRTVPLIFICLLPLALLVGLALGYFYLNKHKIEIHEQTIAQGKNRVSIKSAELIPKKKGFVCVDDQGHKIWCTTTLFDQTTINQLRKTIQMRTSQLSPIVTTPVD